MKKLKIYLMVALMSVMFVPAQSIASPTATTTSVATTNADDAAEAGALNARLIEIKAMDKTNLSFSEKRGLHREVRGIKARLADIGGGVYLSVGAIILIVILLIILL